MSPVVLCPIAASEAHTIALDSDEVPAEAESTLPAAKTAEVCLLESARERDTILENMKLVEASTEPESVHQLFTGVCRKVF